MSIKLTHIVLLLFSISILLKGQEKDIAYTIDYSFSIQETSDSTYLLTSKVDNGSKYISERSLLKTLYFIKESFFDPVDEIDFRSGNRRYDEDDITFTRPDFEDVFIGSNKVYVIKLPDPVKTGDIFHYSYTRNYRDISYFPVIEIPDWDFLEKFSVTIKHPESLKPVFSLFFTRDSFNYKINRKPGETTFQAGPLQSREELDFSPSNGSFGFLFVTINKGGKNLNPASDKEFTDWYGSFVSLKPQLSAPDKEMIKSKISEAGTKEGTLKNIYDFVRSNFRYIAEEQDSCSIIPRSPGQVLKRNYADCKERAYLLSAIAASYGIDVDLALVSSDVSPIINKPFINKYNHMICSYNAGSSIIFMDPTSKYCEFGNLPDEDIGRETLILNPDKPVTVTIPVPNAEPSVTIEINASMDSLQKGKATITLKNDYFSAGLHAYKELPEVKLENFLSNIITTNLYKISLDYFIYEKEDSASITFTAEADLSHFIISSSSKSYIPKTGFTSADNKLLKRKEDIYPVVLNAGINNVLKITLEAPGRQVDNDNLEISNEKSPVHFISSAEQSEQNKILINYRFRLNQKYFSNDEKAALLDFYETYLRNKTNMFILREKK